MCIAVPMKVLKVDGDFGDAELGGIIKEVSIILIDDVKVGDYVLVHAGYAIQKIDENEALETISFLKKLDKKD
jgi:hydrogenase expression/formation protein HypC